MELNKIFDKIYYCCCNTNNSIIEEFKTNNITNIEVKKYTLDKKYYEYSNPKKILFYDIIKEAYNKKYNRIIILTDDIKFTDNKAAIGFYLSKYSNNDICILNPGDIKEDCFIISKNAIDKIYTYIKHINYSLEKNQLIIDNLISKNINISKVPELICYHKIDYVISYVNSNDKVWFEEYSKYALQINDSFNKINRFRSFDILNYHFRSIYYNIKWINNIYLIVSGPTQVPEWISDKVKIIYHNQIIPETYLPTYNSTTIEAFICNIPGLSEYFIYANDDMFVTKKLNKNDFYKNGKIITSYKVINKNTNYIQHCKNGYNIANIDCKSSHKFVVFNHVPHPFIKTSCYHIHKAFNNQLYCRVTQFRNYKNVNQYIFLYYELLSNNFIQSPISLYYTEITNTGLNLDIHKIDESKFMCINDNATSINDKNYDIIKEKISSFLKKIYPCKCIYENHNQSMIDKIDYVFPYVTSDDTYWQNLYKKILKDNNGDINSWASGIERFRDNGLLKYVFRSIEKNMPWVNKVHLIVMRKSQIPKWINLNNVNIIYHKDFIPQKYLPIFNASTLEMFLPNLKVAEQFIYSNDDLICFNKIDKEYFFQKSTPSYYMYFRDYKDSAPGDKVRRNSYITITGKLNDNKVCSTQHGPVPYRLSWINECYKQHKNELLKSISIFREDKNINQYVYSLYQYQNQKIINEKKNIKDNTVSLSKINKIVSMDFNDYDFVCLNDNNSMTNEDWQIILNKINTIFPTKCKYEI